MSDYFSSLRKASENDFPYFSESVTYILHNKETGSAQFFIPKIRKDKTSLSNTVLPACDLVKEGKAVLYAVWQGQWKSDAFIIDDIDLFRKKMLNLLIS